MAIKKLQGEKERSEGVYYEFDTEADVLGQGGMGRVYLGKRIDSKGSASQVAIKITEVGCPSIEYPFEMVFVKPKPREKNKKTTVTIAPVRKTSAPVQKEIILLD